MREQIVAYLNLRKENPAYSLVNTEKILEAFEKNEFDISQTGVGRPFLAYLKSKQKMSHYDAEIIKDWRKRLDEGNCVGFNSFWGYCKSLTKATVKKDEKKPRDDIFFFYATLLLIATSDEKTQFNEQEEIDIERLFSLIKFYQETLDFLPIGQGALQLSLEDTHWQERRFNKEFSLASLFNKKQLYSLFTQDFIPDDKFVNIFHVVLREASYQGYHALGFIKQKDKFSFYDSIHARGEEELSAKELVDKLFERSCSFEVGYLPFGFSIFDFSDQESYEYTNPAEILDKLQVNLNYVHGWSALTMAAWTGCENSVAYFLDKKANPNSTNLHGKSALELALDNGHTEAVKRLIEGGAWVKFEMLLQAINSRFVEIVALLCDLPQIQTDINKQIGEHLALTQAVLTNHSDIVNLLLAAKADTNCTEGNHWTPLMWAIKEGNLEIVDILLKKGAYAYQPRLGISYGPLEVAARYGQLKILKKLIEDYNVPVTMQTHLEAIDNGDEEFYQQFCQLVKFKPQSERDLAEMQAKRRRDAEWLKKHKNIAVARRENEKKKMTKGEQVPQQLQEYQVKNTEKWQLLSKAQNLETVPKDKFEIKNPLELIEKLTNISTRDTKLKFIRNIFLNSDKDFGFLRKALTTLTEQYKKKELNPEVFCWRALTLTALIFTVHNKIKEVQPIILKALKEWGLPFTKKSVNEAIKEFGMHLHLNEPTSNNLHWAEKLLFKYNPRLYHQFLACFFEVKQVDEGSLRYN